MPVLQSEVKLYKSSVGDSVGGGATGTVITPGVKNNLWPDISDLERAADGTRYRKVFLGNDAGVDSLVAPLVWISPDVPGFAPTAIGVGFDDSDDDTANQGNMTALAANAQIEVVSSAADTRTVSLVGLNAAGAPLVESFALDGTTPVLSPGTYSKLYAVFLSAEHATNTVTVKQGAGGTTRGTIGPNMTSCFLWVLASSEATGIEFPDLIAGGRQGIWMRQSWTAGVLALRPATPTLNVKEGS